MADSSANWTVITGSTGGIGREIAKILVARGDALVLVNRTAAKAEAQAVELRAAKPDAKLVLITADLMDTAQIARAIAEIDVLPGRVDALYNNSGILTKQLVLSAQGYESQFAVHALASHQLTRGLMRKMARPAGERAAMVVNFSSSAVNPLKVMELATMPKPEKVGGLMSTYAQTKLAATALAPAMAEELKAHNILIRAIDPGATKSSMTTGNDAMPKVIAWLAPLLFSPADKQAAKIVASADPVAHGGQTGIYVANRKVKKMPAPAADPKAQASLVALLDGMLPA